MIGADHRFTKKRIFASPGFRSVEGACRTVEGYEAMHAIRKGQVRWVAKGDPVAQRHFIHKVFGIAAPHQQRAYAPSRPAICNRSENSSELVRKMVLQIAVQEFWRL